ncbi:hypothetical protein B566_EDAN007484 [Ephemera danica]|nr:hypothetical protein B566_EDAN007484 [Ephemera danica]
MDYSTQFVKCESRPDSESEARVYRCPLCCCMEFYTKEEFHSHLTSVVARINQLQCNECQQGFPSLQEYTEHLLVDCTAVEESSTATVQVKQEQVDCIQYVVVEDVTSEPAEKITLNQVEMQELPIERKRARKSNLVPRKFIESSNDIEPRQPPAQAKASPAKKGKKKQVAKKKKKKKKKDVAASEPAPDEEFDSYFMPTEPAPTGRQSKMPSSFCCEYCGKILKRNDDYIKHVRVHTGEKPCVCLLCGKRFRVTCSLTLHMRTHTNERPYHCSLCPRRFKSHSQLNLHVKSHAVERNYQCPYCEKKFKTISVLASHKKHHFKMLECELCHRPFSTNSLLKKHHRLVHSETGHEFKCSLCGFAFGKAWVLENHLRNDHSEADLENSGLDIENGVPPLECFMDVNVSEPVAEKRVRKQKLIMDM